MPCIRQPPSCHSSSRCVVQFWLASVQHQLGLLPDAALVTVHDIRHVPPALAEHDPIHQHPHERQPQALAGWHLQPRVSKQNPRFFYFHKFQDHAPKCFDFINAVGPQKVLHFCPVYWSWMPKHKPKYNKNVLYVHQFQGGPTPVLYHVCTRVNHGLNMDWTRVRENLVIFKIHEV